MAGLRAMPRPAGLVVCLACAAALLTGSSAGGGDVRRPLRVLQLNLCNSGLAGCYTGLAMAEAAALIRAEAPDVVTVNEVCQGDVDVLEETLAGMRGGGVVVGAFRVAPDRPSGSATRCRNGQPFGIGVLARVPAPYRGHRIYGGTYPSQDAGDPEVRAWLCVHAIAGFYACTTHLANLNPAVALAQCGYLLGTAMPAVRRQGGYAPAVLGGDLNLSDGGSPDVRSCVPSGYLRADDGGVQHVVATTEFTVRSSSPIGLGGTTDHPGLLVTLTMPREPAR
jgi:endonuclease/exonuclease/phosphatase family metal-dependent hydrolase